MGENQIQILAISPDGTRTERQVRITRTADLKEPSSDVERVEFADPKEMLWPEAEHKIGRVRNDGAGLSYGVHEVRLGGPYLAEMPASTLLKVVGARGENYRVRLTPNLDAWIASRDVDWASNGMIQPHLAFTSISVSGGASSDLVTIPYSDPVPFSISPGLSPAGRGAIRIDFYGAHHAATWLSHQASAKVVREVSVDQIAADHLRVTVELEDRQIWGYRWSVTNNAFRLNVRRAPKLPAAPASPLQGLTVALEPGHGGSNTGARGVSGSLEKDINRMAVEELAAQFTAIGSRVVVVRKGDEDLSLDGRTQRAIESNADLFISVHANAASQDRGYLRVSGTSTYYKWSFSRDFSDAIHARLLAHTRLDDFGNVGNFNYYPIRVNTWMPAMLVEQAFMSNPEDEAKMLDPEFRKEMMRAVVLGTEDWLRKMRGE
jgi:N-acetylmuramoyl-L-alanine amidase